MGLNVHEKDACYAVAGKRDGALELLDPRVEGGKQRMPHRWRILRICVANARQKLCIVTNSTKLLKSTRNFSVTFQL
jgi:hypothetical protein